MVFLSSDPLTNPFSAVVAYLTVAQAILESRRDTVSGAGDAAWTPPLNIRTVESIATDMGARVCELFCIAMYVAFG
ncbi:MAG TPA: hypothetical protein VG168_09970 [Bryobacteraceae bacterium]|nr:hypothetical protein [Bryobacteraceae bacterium]